jgi:anti-sigma regulatory factor (Ser/Thr protein kinase)
MTVYALEHHPPVRSVRWPLTGEIQLNTLPESVRLGRAFVAASLAQWKMPWLIDKATLVTSELVTNAIRASWPSHPMITMWLWADGISLVIEVWDEAPGVPRVPVLATADAESGRGLTIVAELSQSWGYYRDKAGKVVWSHLGG